MQAVTTIAPARRANIVEELVEDELFVLPPEGDGAVHCLNGGAAIIYYLCDGERTPEQIAVEISQRHDQPIEQAREWVENTLDELEQLGLVTSGAEQRSEQPV